MNIKRTLFNPTGAHVLMVSFLLALTAAFLLGVERALAKAEDNQRGTLTAVIFFQSSVSDDAARQTANSLPTRDASIVSVQFVSRQEALQEAQKDPGLARSLVLLKENPLPASALVRYRDVAWLDRSEPGEPLRAVAGIQEIRWDPSARTVFRTIHQWRVWIARLAAFALVILLVWAFIGLYRFLALHSPFRALLIQMAIGLIGGGLALALWALALGRLEMDASMYRPAVGLLLPLVTGAVAGLACFGFEARS